VLSVIDLIEADATHLNLAPKGEPQLGRRGLYPSTGGRSARDEQMALLWMLNQSDGNHSMLDVAERSGYPHRLLRDAATKLTAAGLLKPVSDTEAAPSDTGVSAS
jgi:aminopeptidase-like protein